MDYRDVNEEKYNSAEFGAYSEEAIDNDMEVLRAELKRRGYRTASKSKQKPGRIWKDEELSPKKLEHVKQLRAGDLP